jgi:hypothetical protein
MLEGKTWTTQVDLFAVASTIHCLLYNEYMAVDLTSDAAGVTTAAPKLPLKRYWKVRKELSTQGQQRELSRAHTLFFRDRDCTEVVTEVVI